MLEVWTQLRKQGIFMSEIFGISKTVCLLIFLYAPQVTALHSLFLYALYMYIAILHAANMNSVSNKL